jgi:hypothetical protein
VRKRPFPNWVDEKGVAELAGEIIALREAEAQTTWQAFIDFADGAAADGDDLTSEEYAHWPVADRNKLTKFIRAEAAAIEAALHGNPAPLADLLLSEHWEWLQPGTRSLVAELLTDKRNLSTGQPKRHPGRPPMTREERFAANRIHGAAANAQFLQRHLRQIYPGIARAAVRARAVEIAAERADIATEKLQDHLRRSRNDRRRLK